MTTTTAPSAFAHRRGTIAIACAILFLATIVFYAGGATIFVLRMLLIDGAIVLLWLAAAGGFGAMLLRMFRVGFNSIALQTITSAAIGLGLISLAVLLLGLSGAMNRIVAISLLAIGIVLCIAQLAGAQKPRRGIGPISLTAWLWPIVAIAAGIVVVAAMVPPGILFGDEPNGYDVVEYHLQVPREWFETGRITPLHHNVYSFLPFGVEMHYLLAMHVRGGAHAAMYFAQLMHAAMIGMTVAAVFGILVEIRAAGATFGAVLVATTPWMMLLAPIAYNEGGLLLFGTLAIGIAMISLREARQRPSLMILAGTLAGFACGAKLTAVPMVLIAVPIGMAISGFLPLPSGEGRGGGATRARLGIAFVVAGLVILSPWLIRNFVWTRNPVFPEAMSLFGRGHFSETQQIRWDRAHAPRADQHGLPTRARAAGDQIYYNWRFGFLVIPLGVVAFALNGRRREAWFLFVMLIEIMIVWMAFTHLQGRFFVLAIPICGLLVGLCRQGFLIPVVFAGAIGIAFVHARLMEFDRRVPLAGILTMPELDALTIIDPAPLPRDANVVLIGDARAFLYGVPMSRLHYKTVFDVDPKSGESSLDAWRAGTESLAKPVVEVIDPSELQRLSQTYFGIPAPPEDVAARRDPFVVWR